MSGHTRRVVALLGLLLSVSPVSAEEEPRSRSPREQYEALIKEYQEANTAWEKSHKNVTPADPVWIEQYAAWPMWSFAPRFLQFAEANPGEPESLDALLKIVGFIRSGRYSDRFLFPISTRAFSLLSADYLEDERVVEACFTVANAGGPGLEAYLRTLLARSRDRDVRARACIALIRYNALRLSIAERPFFDHPEDNPDYREASAYLNGRRDPDYIQYIRSTDPVAVAEERERLLERVINEFGDLPFPPQWARFQVEGRTLADYARPKLDALRNLAVGKVAPEIQGEDIDGKPMRLSDYRGKVVVLTFWGTWCGPCMRLIPHEKVLVERLKDRPFVLLGINSDTEREKLKDAIKKEGITWRSWWDGGHTGGPIASRWGIHTWPTVIVLDQKGVIRYKHLPHHTPRPLDEAVDSLLNTTSQ